MKSLLSIFCSILLLSTGVRENESLPVDEQPNILWITTEDISPNLACYGDPYAYTPNLDQLAKEGVLYTNAFATAPVCAVARSSIITGVYSSSLGSQHMRCEGKLPSAIKTYPEYLRDAGYYCTNNVKTDFNLNIDDKSVWDECSNTAHWRNRQDPDQPFFAIFNFHSTHESRVNSEERHLLAIENVPEELLNKPGDIPVPPYFPDTQEVRELWARYYNNIIAMDMQVGEILKQLDEDELSDDTIVIFYSDHGAGVPRHKRWLFDSGLQVPLIVRVPEKYRDWLPHAIGSETDELVSFIDLAPTALHLAGVEIPAYMQGRAFLGPELGPERDYIYAGRDRMDERYDMQRAVRDKRFKYIRYYESYKPYCQYMNTPEKGAIMQAIRAAEKNGTMPEAGKHIIAKQKPGEALFDTENDPFELKNLVNDPEFANVLENMRQAHATWSDETHDTGLIPETIIRHWEGEMDIPIYEIMRNKDIPVTHIRETALGQRSQELLHKDLQHENAAIRYWAAIQLGNYPERQPDVSILMERLTDTVPTVRIVAARALEKLGKSEPALRVLKAELQNEDSWTRLMAAQVLDEMGNHAKPAIPALQNVMDDENKYVVRVANHALNNMLGTQNVVR